MTVDVMLNLFQHLKNKKRILWQVQDDISAYLLHMYKPKKRKLSFKEKEEYETIERRLPELEKTKDELTLTLSSGKLSNEELMKNGTSLGKIVEEIDVLTERWIELAEFI